MTATAPVRSNTLAVHYRQQADVCHRMASEALSPYDEEWLRLAAKWTKLARQAELKSEPTEKPGDELAGDPQSAAISPQ
jgi:hypothetical protein